MAVLRSFAGQAASLPHLALSVLLRPQTEDSLNPNKHQITDELHALGVGMVFSDLASGSEEDWRYRDLRGGGRYSGSGSPTTNA